MSKKIHWKTRKKIIDEYKRETRLKMWCPDREDSTQHLLVVDCSLEQIIDWQAFHGEYSPVEFQLKLSKYGIYEKTP